MKKPILFIQIDVKNKTNKIDAADYIPIVKKIAGRIAVTIPSSVSFDELLSAGYLGLLDAIDKYDTDARIRFITYATYRIRGKILDELRDMDHYSRKTRQWANKIEKAVFRVESVLKRPALDYEIADELKITLGRYNKLLFLIYNSTVLSFDIPIFNNDNETFKEALYYTKSKPEDQVYKKELGLILKKAMKQCLTEREVAIVRLYCWEDFTEMEIGNVFELTESRISQILIASRLKLKQAIKKEDVCETL